MSTVAHFDEKGRCPTCGCRRPTWSVQATIAAIRTHHARTGLPPAADEWKKGTPDHPSSSSVLRMFGTWNTAIKEAGFEPVGQGRRRKGRWSRAEMEHAYLTWVFNHGRQPSYRDWPAGAVAHPSAPMCQREYGTWNAFVVACGYEPVISYRTEEGYRKQAVAAARPRDELGRMVAA